MREIVARRIYDSPADHEGFRVLVDRLWPRGVPKERAAIDYWAREIAPSTDLRKWFHHDPRRWEEFTRRYRAELENNAGGIRDVIEASGGRRMILLYSARDMVHNHALVLKEVLEAANG